MKNPYVKFVFEIELTSSDYDKLMILSVRRDRTWKSEIVKKLINKEWESLYERKTSHKVG